MKNRIGSPRRRGLASSRHVVAWTRGMKKTPPSAHAAAEGLEPRRLLAATIVQTLPSFGEVVGTTRTIDLSAYFDDPTINSRVRFTTDLGNIDLELFDADRPATVANFLNYVRDGSYDGTIIHRSTGASSGTSVIGGGGYRPPTFEHIPADPPIADESQLVPAHLNVRGTIATAHPPDDPNSATSEWFINVTNNPNFNASGNTPGRGAVFGQVINNTIGTVDTINALPTFPFNGAFSSLPLRNYTQANFDASNAPQASNLVSLNASVLAKLTYTVTSSIPSSVSASIHDSKLTLNLLTSNLPLITVTASDGTHTVSQSFSVAVLQPSDGPRAPDAVFGVLPQDAESQNEPFRPLRVSDLDPSRETRQLHVTYFGQSADQDLLSAVDLTTIGLDDIALVGSDGSRLTPTSFSTDPDNDGLIASAYYTFSRPGGFGNVEYDVVLNEPGRVRDTQGRGAVPANNDGERLGGLKLGTFVSGTPGLHVTPTLDTDALRSAFVGDASGITVTNFAVHGHSNTGGAISAGTFTNPGGVYGLDAGGGIVITSGDALFANASDSTYYDPTNYQAAPTADQLNLLNGLGVSGVEAFSNVTEIDVDFDLSPGIDSIFLDTVAALDDNSDRAAFAVFVNGENIAGADNDLSIRNPLAAEVGGTSAEDAIIDPATGSPVLRLSKSGLPQTGNRLTLIIANANFEPSGNVTGYFSAIAAGHPRDTVRTVKSFATDVNALAVARQGDALLVAGRNAAGGPVLRRYTAAGVPDFTFGFQGTADSLGLGEGAVQAVSVVGDKILVAGGGGNGGDAFVARYTADGHLDQTFANGFGVAKLDVGSQFDTAYALAVDPQGRIVIAGSTDVLSGGSAFLVARFSTDGILDTSFSHAGDDLTPGFAVNQIVPGDVNRAGGIAFAGSSILVAGQSGSDGSAALERFLDDGQLDTTFDGDGKRLIDGVNTADPVVPLAVQADGRILIAGSDTPSALGDLGGDFLLGRLNPDGSLDSSFGTSGIVRTDMGAAEDIDELIVDGDLVYAVGTRKSISSGTNNGMVVVSSAVARYLAATGAADPSFGTAGFTFFDPVNVSTSASASSDNGDSVSPDGLNRFRELLRAAGVLTDDGGVAVSKANPDGVGSRVVQVAAVQGDAPQSPVASFTSGATLTSSAPEFVFTVTYSDPQGIDVATIGPDDVLVVRAGAADAAALIVKSVALSDPSAGSPRTATYTVAPADGSFGFSDNATYTVRLRAGQVADVTGTASTADVDLGTFTVDVPAPTPAGAFGGKAKLAVDGATFQLSVGHVEAFMENGHVDLTITGATAKSTLTIKGTVTLGDVTSDGPLHTVNGKSATLAGTLAVAGALGNVTLAAIDGGTIAAAGNVAGVTVNSATNAKVLAGANLGADRSLGGGDDSFGAGSLLKIAVKGAVSNSIFAAGAGPGPDQTYGDSDDVGGTGPASVIKSLSIKGTVDASTHFIAGAFPKTVRIPEKVKPELDPHFTVLP